MTHIDKEPLALDTARLRADLADLDRLGERFGQTLTRAFASAAVDGRKLSDVLRGLALSLSGQALTAALKPLSSLIGKAIPFADGGIVNSPLLFAQHGGVGMMGEAGPEAIMPLARGPDGKLGVRGGGSTHITVNITTPDAVSFQRSQSQIAAMMLRALERGNRNL
jgi:phage-related minor tail protein